MEEPGVNGNSRAVTILDVLEVDICRRAILDLVRIKDIVRSERVSWRWQRVVLNYLQHCRSVTFHYSTKYDFGLFSIWPHREVEISPDYDLTVIINKLGSAITKLILTQFLTEISIADLKIFAAYCPHLRSLEICDIDMTDISENELGELFASKDLKHISFSRFTNMTGSFFSFLKNDLESLQLVTFSSPLDYNILSRASCLFNLTKLRIFDLTHKGKFFTEVPLLLNRTPNLENIFLSGDYSETTDEFIEYFGRLRNLKSISTLNVLSNALLETVSKNCERLERVEFSFIRGNLTFWRGLALLIKRRSPGITWLCFSNDITFQDIKDLNKELYLTGCGVQVTQEMVEEAPRLDRTHPYKLRLELITEPVVMERKCERLEIFFRYGQRTGDDRIAQATDEYINFLGRFA